MTIKSFTDLIAWKEGHKLVLMVYRTSNSFPTKEQFGLTSQITRAVISITSNIAEGFSRRSRKESAQFFYVALGSITEVQNQLLIAKDLGYVRKEDFKPTADQTVLVAKLINGLIKSAKN